MAEEGEGFITCEGYSTLSSFDCPRNYNCYQDGAQEATYSCECSRILMASGESCQRNGWLAYLVFSCGAFLELRMAIIAFRFCVASFKKNRTAILENSVPSFIQRGIGRTAEAYRLISCGTGMVACIAFLFFDLLVVLEMLEILDGSTVETALGYLLYSFLFFCTASLYTIYGYILQLAEALQVISRRLSKLLSIFVIMVCLLSFSIGLAVGWWGTPLTLSLAIIGKLGRMIGNKVQDHSFFVCQEQALASRERDHQGNDKRAFRVVALKFRLKAFTRDMEFLIFLAILLLILTTILDFMNDRVPAQFVVLTWGAVQVTTYKVQWKIADFLSPGGAEKINKWLAALHHHVGREGQQQRRMVSFFLPSRKTNDPPTSGDFDARGGVVEVSPEEEKEGGKSLHAAVGEEGGGEKKFSSQKNRNNKVFCLEEQRQVEGHHD